MAAKYAPEQNSDLKCPSCFKKMTEPRALQCFHLFCQPCIDDMAPKEATSDPSYQCPICDETTPKDNVKRLESIEELLGMVQTTKPEDMKCSQCKVEVPSKRCLDCKDNFCADCQEAHNKWAIIAHHKWEDLSEAPKPMIDRNEYCPKHQQELIKLRCNGCKQLICLKCGLDEHKTHKIEDIDSVIKASHDTTRAKIDQVNQTLKQNEDLLTQATLRGETIKQNYEEMEKDIDRKRDEIIKKVRQDCKQLKDQLEEEKLEDFGSVENYRKRVESKIQSQRNAVMIGELALSTACGTSFLKTVDSGIGNALDRRTQDKTKHWALQCKPGKQFSEETNIPSNLIGQITLQPVEKLNCRLADVAKLQANLIKETILQGDCTKFLRIANELFFNHVDTNTIHAHDLNGVHLRTITYEAIEKCSSIVKVHKDIIVASNTGLYLVDLNGKVVDTILTKNVCDVSALGDTLFALSGTEGKVHIIKKNHNDHYAYASDFKLKDFKPEANNTILATENYVYTTQYSKCLVEKYSHTGNHIASFSGSNYPRLSGVDKDGTVFILRAAASHRLATLSKEGVWGQLSLAGLTAPQCAIIEDNQLWLVHDSSAFRQYQLKWNHQIRHM